MPKVPDKNVYAVILIGGKGKRLRPLSTNARPKAFLSVTKDRKTMFRITADRARKFAAGGNILVSANKAHLKLIKADLPGISKDNLMLEPVSRNTGPAIGVAATAAIKRSAEAVIVVMPSDQYIPDTPKYLNSIKSGIDFARDRDCLIVLGLKPTYPSTGFGYIKVKTKARDAKNIYRAERFVEKPDIKTAKKFLKDGNYLWNAGAFIFRADAILRALEKFAPDISGILTRMDKSNGETLYKKFPDISIDYAVMEKARNIYCVRGSYRWRDIGSFESLKKVLQKESRDFVVKNGKIVKIL